jgi:hypothetical protein
MSDPPEAGIKFAAEVDHRAFWSLGDKSIGNIVKNLRPLCAIYRMVLKLGMLKIVTYARPRMIGCSRIRA